MKLIHLLLLSLLSITAPAQLFRCVVAVDGSGTHLTVQEAINACPDNEASIIYIKNGRYEEQVTIGTKAAPSTKILSIIGEHPDSVIITANNARNSTNGLSYEQVVTFQVYASDFYMEGITIENTAGNTGMAEALYTGADRQTFKNCIIRSYQDTYRSKKGTRAYFDNCTIVGAVDFIYAGGVIFFDNCTIRCIGNSGYITAPEDAAFTIPRLQTSVDKFLRLGFIFRDCTITAAPGVPNNSFYLGRPWNSTAGSFYLNCKLGEHINPKGWKEWNGNESSASFAEYNSTDLNGNPVDLSQRVSWSFQLPKADVDNLFTTTAIYARVSTSNSYDPETLVKAPAAPASLSVNGSLLNWSEVEGAVAYLILKNNNLLGTTTELSFTDTNPQQGSYTVRAVGARGQQSIAAGVSALQNPSFECEIRQFADKIHISTPVQARMYTSSGQLMYNSSGTTDVIAIGGYPEGTYLLQLTDQNSATVTKKIRITTTTH